MKRPRYYALAIGAAASIFGSALVNPVPVKAQEAICMGQLMVFGGNFCPRGWTNADGQLLAISQYSALFSIYGTMYGGDGRTTFGLPDLRGRSVVHVGTGAGLPPVTQGSKQGTTAFGISVNEMPGHTHTTTQMGVEDSGNSNDPSGNHLAQSGAAQIYSNTNADLAPMAATNSGGTGGSLGITKRSPMQVIRYCVATQGIFCSRN